MYTSIVQWFVLSSAQLVRTFLYMTEVIARSQCSTTELNRAVRILRAGGTIIYPTDTLYGLGADATNATAVARVRAIKGRDATKPILAMVADFDMLEQYAVLTPLARLLAEHFLPGPLTLVLTARTSALTPIAEADGSVGFRIPNQRLCSELSRRFGAPITSTSVNRTGMQQLEQVDEMLAQLGPNAQEIALVLDIGRLPSSMPSTIVDARGTMLKVLREGVITRAELDATVLSQGGVL